MFLDKLKDYFKNKEASDTIISSIKEVTNSSYSLKLNNSLLVDATFFDGFLFLNIKDFVSQVSMAYCMKYESTLNHQDFIMECINKNILLTMDSSVFPYLKNRYVGVFNNHPDLMDLLTGNDSQSLSKVPNLLTLNENYYPEIKIIKKTVVTGVERISFCLLSKTGSILNKAHFYIADTLIFEIGRFSDFTSLEAIRDIAIGFEKYIDTKKVRILKNDYNPCLLYKQGRKYELIVEHHPSHSDKQDTVVKSYDRFMVITYESGNLSIQYKQFFNSDYIDYVNKFKKVYMSRYNYCLSRYPSMQTLRILKEIDILPALPLSDDTLMLLSMYSI